MEENCPLKNLSPTDSRNDSHICKPYGMLTAAIEQRSQKKLPQTSWPCSASISPVKSYELGKPTLKVPNPIPVFVRIFFDSIYFFKYDTEREFLVISSVKLKLKSVEMICLIIVQVHLPVRFAFPINRFLG